jgi:hypothetical protein
MINKTYTRLVDCSCFQCVGRRTIWRRLEKTIAIRRGTASAAEKKWSVRDRRSSCLFVSVWKKEVFQRFVAYPPPSLMKERERQRERMEKTHHNAFCADSCVMFVHATSVIMDTDYGKLTTFNVFRAHRIHCFLVFSQKNLPTWCERSWPVRFLFKLRIVEEYDIKTFFTAIGCYVENVYDWYNKSRSGRGHV